VETVALGAGFNQNVVYAATFHPEQGWKVSRQTAEYDGVFGVSLTTQSGVVVWRDVSHDLGTGNFYYTIHYGAYDPSTSNWVWNSWRSGYVPSLTVSAPAIANATVTWTAGGSNYKRGFWLGGNGWWINSDTWTRAFFVATPSRGNSPLAVWCIDMSMAANPVKWNFGDGTPLVTARTTYHNFVGNCNQFLPIQLAYDTDGRYDSYGYYVFMDNTPPTGSILINGGAPTTPSSSVTLTLSATDNCGVASMRFSNDGTTWADLEPYATTKNWTLASGEGTRTVYVYFKDGAGNASGIYSDSITVYSPVTVLDVVDVSPDPRASPVAAVEVVFSKQINLSTFTYQDVSLARNGSTVPLDSSVTASAVSGTTYRVSGLAGFTTSAGTYTLTVSAAGIADTLGYYGSGSAADTWTVCLPDPNVVFVDRAYQGTVTNGANCTPFRTVTDGYAASPSGNTIRIFSGNYNESLLNMNKPLVLSATNGTVNIIGLP
jgi:hypothetical protein